MMMITRTSSQAYRQVVTVTNPLDTPLEATLRAGSAERYTITPSTFQLAGGKSIDVDIRLKVTRFGNKKKATEQGQKDVFHIKVRRSSHILDVHTGIFRRADTLTKSFTQPFSSHPPHPHQPAPAAHRHPRACRTHPCPPRPQLGRRC